MENQRSDTQHRANANHPGNELHARCSDISGQHCDWQTSGRNEDEVLRNVEQHGRERHGVNMTPQDRDRARNAIRGGNRHAA